VGGTTGRFLITNYSNATTVQATADLAVPAGLQNTARFTWSIAKQRLYGVRHLGYYFGSDVAIVGDGAVVANPFKTSLTTRAVNTTINTQNFNSVNTGGWYTTLSVGLPYVWDLKTLHIDTADPFQSLAGHTKLITNVMAYLQSSVGIWVGESLPTDDNSQSGLRQMVPVGSTPSPQTYGDDVISSALVSEIRDVNISGQYNDGGQIVMRGVDPVPVTILAVAPRGNIIPRAR
jgi:hypothetical protein